MIYVICNPVAGNGRGKKIGEQVQAELKKRGIPHEFYLTEFCGHATKLAEKAVSKGADKVFAVGGDGTVLEAARGLIHTDTALCIIPGGTGNDFIKTIGIPKDPSAALEAALSHAPRKTDAVWLNDRLFLNEAGVGFDVSVLEYAKKAKKLCRGLLPYLYGVVRTIFSFSGIRVVCQLEDGKAVERDILVLGVGNGRFIGGGIEIAPKAVPDDGLLDVVIIKKMKKPRMMQVLPLLLKGKVLTFKETEWTRVRRLSFQSEHMSVNVDGEILPMEKADISVIPDALYICRP